MEKKMKTKNYKKYTGIKKRRQVQQMYADEYIHMNIDQIRKKEKLGSKAYAQRVFVHRGG